MTLESQTILLAISAAFVSSATNIAFAPALRQMGSFALAQVNNLGNSVMLGAIGFWMLRAGEFSLGGVRLVQRSGRGELQHQPLGVLHRHERHRPVSPHYHHEHGSASQLVSGGHFSGRRAGAMGIGRNGSRRSGRSGREL